MSLRPIPTAVAVVVSLLAIGCTEQSQQADAPEAADQTDNLGSGTLQSPSGFPVRESLFLYYARNVLQKPPNQLTAEERDAVLESLASLELLAEAAMERGLPRERTIAVELELQRQQILARAMVNRYVEENQPTEAELQAEYDASASQFARVEHKARHILLETEEDADDVIDELRGGADFAELARERSTDPASGNGGDLGWFTADSMVAPFAEAVSAMEVGSFSQEPVQTNFGWHVILLEDRRDSDPPGLDAVRNEIVNRVTQRRIEEFIESLREEASASP